MHKYLPLLGCCPSCREDLPPLPQVIDLNVTHGRAAMPMASLCTLGWPCLLGLPRKSSYTSSARGRRSSTGYSQHIFMMMSKISHS